MNWHRLTIEDTYRLLKTGPNGLNQSDAEGELIKTGANELKEAKKKSPMLMLLLQFRDVTILILLAAALVSGFVGEFTDSIVILVIVLLNAALGFFQEYRAEKAIYALKQLAVTQTRVVRSGINKWMPATQLVPGDIIMLEAGNAVPADVRIVESINLQIEEAALTGESIAVIKVAKSLDIDDLPLGDKVNMAFKGTFVASGRGKAVVVVTGMQTELGQIAKMLQEPEVMTPLQKRMNSFSKKLSVIVLMLCLLFLAAGYQRNDNVVTLILTSISMAVAAIPEALPAVITISLALAAKRMIKLNSLIRKLPAVETLGSITYICTDKTGTLTKNKMYVDNVFFNGMNYHRNDLSALSNDETFQLLLSAFALNNDVFNDPDGDLKGDSTEIGLIELANEQRIGISAWPRIGEIAFDSERKLMTTFHHHEGKIIAFTKGAPDILVQHCLAADTQGIYTKIEEMAGEGLRVLGFAYRYWEEIPPDFNKELSETGLKFIGLAGLIDPPRDEVIESVAQCRKAGIIPVMITGDHPITAMTIAKRIGILRSNEDMVLTGRQLAEMDSAEFLSKVESIKVYARVTPLQKLQIVKGLQKRGHFVAMTGDGVNDAPSLKRADIGIAMGITGTDVSREAAHMILLDDNFSTIVKAIREGRRIYDNILKFIKYLMTTNSGELWTLLAGPMFGLPVALLPIHILWINLVSDGLPAISLSFEKAEINIMSRPPRPPQESVFANGRGWHIVWVGMFMAAIALTIQAWAIRYNLHWQTIVFNVLCLSQMGHVLAIRSESSITSVRGLFSNKPLIGAVLLAFLFQFIITYVPFLQKLFNTESLTLPEFILVGIASSLVFFAVESEKYFSGFFQSKKSKCEARQPV